MVRDGCHYKVKDELPISMASFYATLDNIDMHGEKVTPKTFAQAADRAFEIQNISKSLAYCGLVCKLCHFADSCDGCKSDNNCCGLRKTDAGCYQYVCCSEKGIKGCWRCETAPCDKGMFSESHDVRLRAFVKYIKEKGKDKLFERLYLNM